MKGDRGSRLPLNSCMAYILMVAALAADQVTKYLIRTNMRLGESVSVIGDFFCLTYFENDGAAFSTLRGHRAILIIIPIIAIAAGLVYMLKNREAHRLLHISLALIISGGAGNLIDRAVFGKVTDMFDFSIFPPIFNVADICVVAGCGLLMIYIFMYEKLEKKNE